MPIRHRVASLLAPALLISALAATPSEAADDPPAATIVVASTTSTVDTGLFDHLLPLFEARTGITVHVVAQGTGQALDTGRRGDADVVFVHAREAEERFVAEGYGVRRQPVMYNDFVIVGPRADPAGIRGTSDAVAALQAIRAAEATFVSRGDDSGTHLAERALWAEAGVDEGALDGAWYRAIGQGMGAALNMASASDAHVLTDRGTWLSFRNRGTLEILVDGDPRLFNQYGVILVDPERHPHIRASEGQAFVDWLLSDDGQRAIGGFTIDGQRLFFPNAGDPDA